MARLDYSVVIPVYNSAASLESLVPRLSAVFRDLNANFEILLVDDGSPNPMTWPTIEALALRYPELKPLRHEANRGQHHAFRTGLRQADGDYIITMDDDGEHRPEDIPLLLAEKQHDVVMAHPPSRKHWFEQWTSRLKMKVENLLWGHKKPLYVTAFCLFPQRVNQVMLKLETPYPVLSTLQMGATRDIVNVVTHASERLDAHSNYTFLKRLKLFVALVYSSLKLRRS